MSPRPSGQHLGHRKTVRHFDAPGHLRELTFSCYLRMPLLTSDDWRRRLAGTIDAAGQRLSVRLVAFVMMPEHVHLLVQPAHEVTINRYLRAVKESFSRQIKPLLVASQRPLLERLMVRERPGKECFRFWQEGPGFDRNLFSPRAIAASIDYIHNNPVTRGLCQRAIDWKWSSARYYLAEPAGQQHPDLPRIDGIEPDVLDQPFAR